MTHSLFSDWWTQQLDNDGYETNVQVIEFLLTHCRNQGNQ